MTTHSQGPDDLLTVVEVSRLLRLDPTTVRRWIKEGRLPAIALPHKGSRTVYRLRRHTIDALLVESRPM